MSQILRSCIPSIPILDASKAGLFVDELIRWRPRSKLGECGRRRRKINISPPSVGNFPWDAPPLCVCDVGESNWAAVSELRRVGRESSISSHQIELQSSIMSLMRRYCHYLRFANCSHQMELRYENLAGNSGTALNHNAAEHNMMLFQPLALCGASNPCRHFAQLSS